MKKHGMIVTAKTAEELDKKMNALFEDFDYEVLDIVVSKNKRMATVIFAELYAEVC